MSRATMICIFATTLGVSVTCHAQAPRVVAEKLYDQMNQAVANHDFNRLYGFYDSSYVDTDEHGRRVAFAEYRRQGEKNWPLFRRIKPSTTIEDVQLKADRMVVYYKYESHFEFYDRRNGWIPEIYKVTGENTWERKGGQWKLVLGNTILTDLQVDPRWAALVKQSIDDRRAIINCADGCPYPH